MRKLEEQARIKAEKKAADMVREAERKAAEQARIAREEQKKKEELIAAQNRAIALNLKYSGKHFGNYVTRSQLAAIRNGTFKGLGLGDYWTIDGVNWRIADFDYLIRSDNARVDASRHHIMIVPDSSLYRQL